MESQMTQTPYLPEWFRIISIDEGSTISHDGEEAVEGRTTREDMQIFGITIEYPNGNKERIELPIAHGQQRKMARRFKALEGRTLVRPKRLSTDPAILQTLDLRTRKSGAEIIKLSPYECFFLLKHNLGNRVYQETRIERYMAELSRGVWYVTNQGLGSDWNGSLIDGQHRLIAALLLDVAFETVLVWGLNPKAKSKADTGAPRTAADIWDLNYRKSASSPPGKFVVSSIYGLMRILGMNQAHKQDTFYVPLAEHHADGLEWLYGILGPESEAEAKRALMDPRIRAALLIGYKYNPTKTDEIVRMVARSANLVPGTVPHSMFAYVSSKSKGGEAAWRSYWTLHFLRQFYEGESPHKKLRKPELRASDALALMLASFGGSEVQVPIDVTDEETAQAAE